MQASSRYSQRLECHFIKNLDTEFCTTMVNWFALPDKNSLNHNRSHDSQPSIFYSARAQGTNIRYKRGEAQEVHQKSGILEITWCGKISWHIPAMSDCTCAARTSFEIRGLFASGDLNIEVEKLTLHCVFPLPFSLTPVKHARSFKEKIEDIGDLVQARCSCQYALFSQYAKFADAV